MAVMVALIQAELKFPSWTECGNSCLRDFKIVVLDSLRWYKIFLKVNIRYLTKIFQHSCQREFNIFVYDRLR